MARLVVRAGFSALALLVWLSPNCVAQQPLDSVVPASTKVFAYTASFPKLLADWKQTEFGQLFNDPAMQPFRADLERQLGDKDLGLQKRIGLSLTEISDLATGEVAIAMIPTAEKHSTVALLANVKGNEAKAQARMAKMTAAFTARGGTLGSQPVAGVNLTMFNLPPAGNIKMPQAAYCLRGSLLLVTDNIGTAATLLRRLAAARQPGLDSVPAYKAVLARAAKGNPLKPDLSWYVDPIGLLECIETDNPHEPGSGPDPLKIAKDEGFSAIQAVGGMVSLAAGPYGAVHRTCIHAPPPYEKAMRMAAFSNGGDFKPQSWAPQKLSTYTSFHWDMLTAFDSFGTLFDAIFGDGEEGVWDDMLRSLREDPNGPQIDLRQDLVANLGHRATVLTDVEMPITPHSQCRIFAAEATNPAALAQAIDKSMRNDPGTKKQKFGKYTIYEILPEDDDVEDAQPVRKRGHGNPAPGQGGRLLPNSAVAVAHGTLFVSTHVSFLKKVLANADGGLAQSTAYQGVEQHLQKLGATNANTCMQEFSNNAERWFPAYELFRTNKLPESDLFVASLLNRLFPQAPEGQVRAQQIDGSKLPDYAVVRRYLGTGGAFATAENDGWFLIGFTLSKANQQQANQQPKAAALQ